MFQFRRFPTYSYLIHHRLTGSSPAGLPHSEISGSMLICSSPKLFAAYHVFHRLLMPRHSPCALHSLTSSEQTPYPSLPASPKARSLRCSSSHTQNSFLRVLKRGFVWISFHCAARNLPSSKRSQRSISRRPLSQGYFFQIRPFGSHLFEKVLELCRLKVGYYTRSRVLLLESFHFKTFVTSSVACSRFVHILFLCSVFKVQLSESFSGIRSQHSTSLNAEIQFP